MVRLRGGQSVDDLSFLLSGFTTERRTSWTNNNWAHCSRGDGAFFRSNVPQRIVLAEGRWRHRPASIVFLFGRSRDSSAGQTWPAF